jgi:small conductance mechanosensitive channel
MSGTVEYLQHFADLYLVPLGIRILMGLAIFVFGRIAVRILVKGFDRVMETSKLEISLRKFLHDVVYAVLLVAVIVAALDAVGVKTTAVIAVLGAAGLAVGLALQGSLSNFAAGVMLIVLRPYKVTDLVVIGKYLGRVEAIRVFDTILITEDHREITIPNGQIIAGPIENLTVLGRRRVNLIVTITDANELHRVKQLLETMVAADPRVHAAPPPSVQVAEISEWAVKLYLRPWTSAESYDAVTSGTMERIRETMVTAGLKFSVTVQPTSAI